MNSQEKKLLTTFQENKNKINRLVRKSRLLTQILAGILGIFFSYLKLNDVRFGLILNEAYAIYFYRSALIIYYFSWIFGVINDLNLQNDLYLKSISKEDLPWHSNIIAILVTVNFGLLCYARNPEEIVTVLMVFTVMNLFNWIYFKKYFVRLSIDESLKVAIIAEDYTTYAKILVYEKFMVGNWKWKRHIISIALSVALLLLTFNFQKTKIFIIDSMDLKILTAIGIFLFVILTEGWIWLKRIEIFIALRNIDYINHKFRISLIEEDSDL